MRIKWVWERVWCVSVLEFIINSIKAWNHLAFIDSLSWWWCNGNVLVTLLGSLEPTEHCLYLTNCLRIIAGHFHPFRTSEPILSWFLPEGLLTSQSSNHQIGFLNITVSHQISIQCRTHLGDLLQWEIYIMAVKPTNLQRMCVAICQYGKIKPLLGMSNRSHFA